MLVSYSSNRKKDKCASCVDIIAICHQNHIKLVSRISKCGLTGGDQTRARESCRMESALSWTEISGCCFCFVLFHYAQYTENLELEENKIIRTKTLIFIKDSKRFHLCYICLNCSCQLYYVHFYLCEFYHK